MNVKEFYFDLLKDWCDALLKLQIKDFEPSLNGGMMCRSCKMIHGRCPDSIYPLTVMARLTGDKKYLDAAEAVFNWGEEMLTDTGAVYNDAQSTWLGITVFNATAICEALECGKELYSPETVEKFEARLKVEGEWLFEVLDENYKTNINYVATNACALELLGKYLGRDDYRAKAARLAEYIMNYFTYDGFLFGESKPRDGVSPLGCRPVDIGYNVEESVPSMVKYAVSSGNGEMLDKLCVILKKQLDFMLPDGAWDNSFGTRNNKWTYWGSRTSDGCNSVYTLLCDRDPAFAEAALRNTELLRACTHNGLLYGGPHYLKHGEHPCTHHTFEHANALAFALMHCDKMPSDRTTLPVDEAKGARFYPDINTYKIAVGDYRATVTGFDFAVEAGVHISGGTLSMLYKYGEGPKIAASVMDYKLVEAHNMQLPLKTKTHRPLVPRLANGAFSSAYFVTPEMKKTEENGSIKIAVKTGLCASDRSRMIGDITRNIEYTFTPDGVRIRIDNASGTKFILPLISGDVELKAGELEKKEDIFFLTGGFEAVEYVIKPDQNNNIELNIR